MKTLIRDAQIVAEGRVGRGSVLIGDDGRISDVLADGAPLPSADDVVDASGLYLLPGAIDDHVHFREPGLTQKADMASESAAAVLGGVTSVMDMPNTVPQTTSVEAWQAKMDAARGRMLTNYAFYIGATNDNADELLRADYSRVCGVKVFMGSSTGGMLVNSEASLRQIFAEAPTLIAAHCEDEAIIRANAEKARAVYGDNVPWAEHPKIRAAEACYESSLRAVEMARQTQARLHIMHITTARELELLDAPTARRRVTGEACPAHLWFTDADYSRLGPLIKCNPAVKTAEDRDALRRAVASGLISTIGTDHAPHAKDEKFGHDYWHTPSGMPMIQHSVPLMMRLADEGWWDYPTVARLMAEGVAELYGIEDRGHIRAGQWADITLLRPCRGVVKSVAYKCGWSPLMGETLNHRVERTYVNGRLVAAGGKVVGSAAMPLTFIPRR